METSLSHWTILKPTGVGIAGEAISKYTNHEALFLLFENGTALLMKPEMENQEVIDGAMSELSFKGDFNVMPMKDGHFTVWLANPVCVFISKDEAKEIIEYVRGNEEKRIADGIQDRAMPEDMVIGIAGREKAHRDANTKRQVFRFEPGI